MRVAAGLEEKNRIISEREHTNVVDHEMSHEIVTHVRGQPILGADRFVTLREGKSEEQVASPEAEEKAKEVADCPP